MTRDSPNDSDYNALALEHFERPRNVGRLAPGHGVIAGMAGKREQGVQFVLTARIAGDHLAELRFEAYGCPHCIAAGSVLTERLQGATYDRLAQWSWRELAATLGVPTAKRGRLLILEDAVHALAADWRSRL
jgi:nitrogen fixation protein NifU and related proteins